MHLTSPGETYGKFEFLLPMFQCDVFLSQERCLKVLYQYRKKSEGNTQVATDCKRRISY
jgi:hypothetical protein